MQRRFFTATVLFLGVEAGCVFSPTSPEDQALIRCAADADCPDTWRCSAVEQICVPPEQAPPQIQVALDSNAVRAGAELHINVTVDQALVTAPVLEPSWDETPFELMAVEGRTYRYRYVANGQEPEGTQSVRVTAEGAAKSSERFDVHFDFTPPSVEVVFRRPIPDPGVSSGAELLFFLARLEEGIHLDGLAFEWGGDASDLESPQTDILNLQYNEANREGVIRLPDFDANLHGQRFRLRYFIHDDAGNENQVLSSELKIDLVPPEATFVMPGTVYSPLVTATVASADAVAYRLYGDLNPETNEGPEGNNPFLPVVGNQISFALRPLTGNQLTPQRREVFLELKDGAGNISAPFASHTFILPGLFAAPVLVTPDEEDVSSISPFPNLEVRGFVSTDAVLLSARLLRNGAQDSIQLSQGTIEIDPDTGMLAGSLDGNALLLSPGEWVLEVYVRSIHDANQSVTGRSPPISIVDLPVSGVIGTNISLSSDQGNILSHPIFELRLQNQDRADVQQIRFIGDADAYFAVGSTAFFVPGQAFQDAGNHLYTVNLIGPGVHTLRVETQDAVGQLSQASISVIYDPDIVDADPFLFQDGAEMPATEARPGGIVQVTGRITPTTAQIESATLRFGDEEGCRVNVNGLLHHNGTLHGEVVVPLPPNSCDATMSLEVVVSDQGVRGAASGARSNPVYVDQDAPASPTISAPQYPNAQIADVTVAIYVESKDEDVHAMKIQGDVELDGAVEPPWVPMHPGRMLFPVTLTSIRGTKTISVRVRDRVGNESAASTLQLELIRRERLVRIDALVPSSRCPAGGTRTLVGMDLNGNGILDDDEIDAITEICSIGERCAPGSYRETSESTCIDVNECETENGGCGDADVFECVNNENTPPSCVRRFECEDGETETLTCGKNARGMENRTCISRVWTISEACIDPDECIDGQVETLDEACVYDAERQDERHCVVGKWERRVRCTFSSCAEALAMMPESDDGVYPIDPDGPGSLPPSELFCDMAAGGWSLIANVYDASGDDVPNDTSYVLSGWEQSGNGQWSVGATTVKPDTSGVGSAAVSLEFVAALAQNNQQNLKICLIGAAGETFSCRSSAAGTLTPVSYGTGNPKLVTYHQNEIAYTFGRLAGLAGSVDGYDPSEFGIDGYRIPIVSWNLVETEGLFGTDGWLAEHATAVGGPWGDNEGVWHAWGGGVSFRPWFTNEFELGAELSGERAAGFRIYVGPGCAAGALDGGADPYAVTWGGELWGACSSPTCLPGYHLENSQGCVSDTRSCFVFLGEGEEIWVNGEWSDCLVNSCESGFHMENNACEPNTRDCSIEAGVGKQNWSGAGWGQCIASSCFTGFHLEGNACPSNRRSCLIENGEGEQTWSDGTWSACVATDCDLDFHLDEDVCLSNVRSCMIDNGEGEQSWLDDSWGACIVSSCNAGYVEDAGECVSELRGCETAAFIGVQHRSGGVWGPCEKIAGQLVHMDPSTFAGGQTWNDMCLDDDVENRFRMEGSPVLNLEPVFSWEISDNNYFRMAERTEGVFSAWSQFLWVYPTRSNGVQGLFASRYGNGGGTAGIHFELSGRDINYAWGNQYWQVDTGLQVTLDAWNLIGMTVNATEATVFHSDGNTLSSFTHSATHLPQTIAKTTDQFYGTDPESPGGRSFEGKLGELLIWERDLDVHEVNAIWEITRTHHGY